MKEGFKGSEDAPIWWADEAWSPLETVLERPDLVIGTCTGNIGLMKGEGYVYVRICKVLHQTHRLGVFIPLAKVKASTTQDYTGPIDDELMANILVYGG